MKITFILPAILWKPSGGYRVIYEYANHLSSRGHDINIVHPRFLRNEILPPPPNLYRLLLRKAGYVRKLIKKPNTSKWQPINNNVRMLYVDEPVSNNIPDSDVVFATAWKTTDYVAEYPTSKGLKFYLVMDFGNWFGPQDELEFSWKLPFKKVTISRWLYEQVISVIAPNNKLQDNHEVLNIPLGIDHNRFKKTNDIANRPKKVTMMYSIYSPYKAGDDGLQAIKICKDIIPDLQVTIFGIQHRPRQIPSWVDYRYNISEDELINIYNQSRIFVCSSRAEGFALPPAEAMACGCAVATTDCGGNREYAKDEITALVSQPNNPEVLANNIIRFLEDDNLRIKIAEAGYKNIQQFNWENSTNLLERYILQTKHLCQYDRDFNIQLE
jgi:glycosyltransferase involved in cell wall biosynthesis